MSTDQVTEMFLTEVEIEGHPVSVSVRTDGTFVAEMGGDGFDSTSLSQLRHQLELAVRHHKVEVPFVLLSGRRGVMRAPHGKTNEILVTYEDGTKDKLGTFSQVFRAGAVSDEEIETMRRLKSEIEERTAALEAFKERTERATVIYAEAVGEDVFGRRR